MDIKKGDKRAVTMVHKDKQLTLQKESNEKGNKERKKNLKATESTNG